MISHSAGSSQGRKKYFVRGKAGDWLTSDISFRIKMKRGVPSLRTILDGVSLVRRTGFGGGEGNGEQKGRTACPTRCKSSFTTSACQRELFLQAIYMYTCIHTQCSPPYLNLRGKIATQSPSSTCTIPGHQGSVSSCQHNDNISDKRLDHSKPTLTRFGGTG